MNTVGGVRPEPGTRLRARSIEIQRTTALERAAEIKELFLAHDGPEFPEFFDRAYPRAFSAGASSWLGRQEDGRVAMHIACFRRRFRFGSQELVGGLLLNLMVSTPLRTFFPAVSLVRRVVADSKVLEDIDFLYADPNQQASPVFRAAGFTRVGTIQRYILPIASGRGLVDVGIRAFHALIRARHGWSSRLEVVTQPARQVTAEPLGAPDGSSPLLRAYHDRGVYASWLRGYPSDVDWWFTGHRRGPGAPPAAALLVRGPDSSGLAGLRAIRRAPGFALASLLPAFTRELRRRGCTRCQVVTVAESALGRELRNLGFLPRQDRHALFTKALTPRGADCVRSVGAWEGTDVDFDP